MEYVLILLGIILLCWVVFTQFGGRRQLIVDTDHSESEARQIVAQTFGLGWKEVDGPGGSNFRPRLRYKAPVISVNYQENDDGGCRVHVWVSGFSRAWAGVIMMHAQLAWRKKWILGRRLLVSHVETNKSESIEK